MTQNTQTERHQLGQLIGANKCDHYYELHYSTGEIARLYILAEGIFRYFLDPTKKFDENHSSFVDLSQFNNSYFEKSKPKATSDSLIISSGNYQLIFQQKPAVMNIFDETLHRSRVMQSSPLELGGGQTTEILKQHTNEFYFGGGMQNGYFSHKGQIINIKRDHITGKGGVLTQVPFFWANSGFGELRNTEASGTYDFGKTSQEATILRHDTAIFDTFYLLGNSPKDILTKYFALTGKPLMPPKYALGLGHIGNFLTTMWQPGEAKERNATMFEDGNYYTRTTNPEHSNGKASLNGEEEFQFSARAMVDRYEKQHFKLSWMIPNYHVQDIDAEAMTSFSDYAASRGVNAGLWSEHETPKATPDTTFIQTNTSDPKILKDDALILRDNLKRKRPLIFSNTGIAGSQYRTMLAFGDIGGNWENIPTQVAGFLGASLSGQPLIGSAVDGTAGGGNAQISIRDFEWKAFTPILFNLDDQGDFSKTPFAYNSKMTKINRAYLKLREQLQTYLYTLIYRAQVGEPIMRPLFLEFPHEQINYTPQVGHEFMLGPNLLISPIVNGREDGNGNSRKDNLYLPNHRTMWVDLFDGQKYLGGRVYNKQSYPSWHLPVFVRGGSIFDLGDRNYVLYPQGRSKMVTYDDNGYNDYSRNHVATQISSNLEASKLTITIDPTQGDFSTFQTENTTNLNIMCDGYPDGITIKINDHEINMQEYGTVDTFAHAKEGFFFNTNYSWMPEFDQYQEKKQTALQIKLAKRDITDSKIEITIRNFRYGNETLVHAITDSLLRSPKQPTVDPDKISSHSLTVVWPQLTDQVQIEVNGILHDGIDGSSFTFHELVPNTRYTLRLRYVAKNKVSEWSDPFGAITKPDPMTYAIDDIQATSSLISQTDHPIEYLTDLKLASEWETINGVSEDKPLVLNFKFNQLEHLSRMVWVPRKIDHQGDPVEVSVETSTDGTNFKPYGERLTWKSDSKNKVVGLRDVEAKAIKLKVYKSSGPFVAAKEVIFFREKKNND